MNRRNTSGKKRILILVSVLMLMLLLCGCRTRITNNTEVTRTMQDESGYMSDSYQARRDELGIPVADAPLFDRGGSGEDDEYSDEFEEYDESYEEYDEYDSEDEGDIDEEEYEDEDDTDDGNTTSSRTSSSTTPVSRIQRQPTHHTYQTTTSTTVVRVSLNANAKDAKCSRAALAVRKGSTYGSLPTPIRDGYTFEGWYTAKSGGNKVTSSTKVNTDKAHTLYAHWKETKKKSFTISFDGNSEEEDVELSGTEITVKEGGTYGKLPSAKRSKYKFLGWYTDAKGGSKITSSTKFTANKKQTLYAHWEQDSYNWWKGEFEKAANEIDSESEIACLIDEDSEGDNDKAESFLKSCRIRKSEEETDAAVIVKFVKDYDEEKIADEVNALYEKHSETLPAVKVIIISNDALYGGKEEKLLYKMTMLNDAYGGSYDLYEAEFDLNDGKSVGLTSMDF